MTSSKRSLLKKILLAVSGLILLLAGGAAYMIGPRNIVGLLFYDQRREGAFHVGDKAPDVVLGTLDGSREVHLAEFIGDKPLVLVFGSFT